MNRKPNREELMKAKASVEVESPKGTELDVLREIFTDGDPAALKTLTAAAMISLSGSPVAEELVAKYLDGMRRWVVRAHEAISAGLIPA